MTQNASVSQGSLSFSSAAQCTRNHPAVYSLSTHTPGSDDEYRTGWILEQRSLTQSAATMCRAWWSPHVFVDGVRAQNKWFFSDWLTFEWNSHDFPLGNARKATRDCARILGTSTTRSVILAIPLADRCYDIELFKKLRQVFMREVPVEKSGAVPRYYAPLDGVEASAGPRFDWRHVLGV